jgi:hypothetical protein
MKDPPAPQPVQPLHRAPFAQPAAQPAAPAPQIQYVTYQVNGPTVRRQDSGLGMTVRTMGIVALSFMLVGFIPCLGWLNYINIFLSFVTLIIGIVAVATAKSDADRTAAFPGCCVSGYSDLSRYRSSDSWWRLYLKLVGPAFVFRMPSAVDWWQSVRWVLLVFTLLAGLALLGSFVSYERVMSAGHPWLPSHRCPGCLFCGMTRSFCAMSNGRWEQASEWNRGGPALYAFFWIWLISVLGYLGLSIRGARRRRV